MSQACGSVSNRRLKRISRGILAGYGAYEVIHARICDRAYQIDPSPRRRERHWRNRSTPFYTGSQELSAAAVDNCFRDYLELLNVPRALTVWLLYKNREHRQLVQLTTHPDEYPYESDVYAAAYAATNLFRKCAGLDTGINTDEVAVRTAAEAEVKNRETNTFFRLKRSGLVTGLLDGHLDRIKSTIARALGDCPSVVALQCEAASADKHYEQLMNLGVPRDVGWSNGRTTSASGDHLSQLRKYLSTCDVTAAARGHAERLISDSPGWRMLAELSSGTGKPTVTTRGNVMMVVPKDARTGRVICYEPHMNIRLQLAVGGYIRECLRKVGIDLSDQSVQQRRARFGSRYGRVATLDLKSASDRLASEVVWELLPIDWACLLDDLRSHETLWPDSQWRRNEKFSSMGNGFTFELESLIFYAICSAVSHSVSVYGDDIILPAENAGEAAKLLRYYGFDLNERKSFASGPFRESCGVDAYLGDVITPVYLRRIPKTLRDFSKFHNAVYHYSYRKMLSVTRPHPELPHVLIEGPLGFTPQGSAVQDMCRGWRKRFPFFTGPEGFGDGHYHVPSPREAWLWNASSEHESAGWEGWWFLTETPVYPDNLLGEDRILSELGGVAAILASTGPTRPENILDTLADRRAVGYRVIRTLVSKWPRWGVER
nr:MAG: RNA replicase beta chain [Sanya fiers-like virus 7]